MDIKATDFALFSTFFLGLLLLLAYCWRWRRYFELGMKLPGPPALPLIGNCHYFTTSNSRKCFQEFNVIPGTYGPISRLWFGPVLLVILTDPDSIEKVVKHDKIGTRGYIAKKALGSVFENGLVNSEGEKWRKHRKIVSSALHINILESFVEIFAENSEILANKLKIISDGDNAHDILPDVTRCILNIIFETCLDVHVNAEICDAVFSTIETVTETSAERILKPWLLIEWIMKLSKLGRKYYYQVKLMRDNLMHIVEKERSVMKIAKNTNINERKCSLLHNLIQHCDSNKEDIMGEINSIIGAATETTSHACCYVLALLAENQYIQDRVMQEQEDIFGEDILRSVKNEDLPRMEYLEQVLKEAIRLFPPISIHFRAAVKEIDLENGYIIPQGATILMPAYSLHRDPKLYPDPEKFDPDRFSPQNCVDSHPYAYTPFGIGRRMCVGHVFATMEAKVILSTVLRHYQFTEIEGGIRGLEKTIKLTYVLPPANGVCVKLLPRSYASR